MRPTAHRTRDVAIELPGAPSWLNATMNHGGSVQDLDQCTPLHFAAGNGHLEVCDVLLRRECNPKVADKDGWLPITFAANDGHAEVVEG